MDAATVSVVPGVANGDAAKYYVNFGHKIHDRVSCIICMSAFSNRQFFNGVYKTWFNSDNSHIKLTLR